VNSGAALVAGVVGISLDDIGKQMLPGDFILIESQDEIPDV
jgi:predicted ATP-grasp superfamily ATP-dependent carboligase